MNKVFDEVSEIKLRKKKTLFGKVSKLPKNIDVFILAHSLFDFKAEKTSFKGVHLVRDPRDVIVSGYLYHKRTSEKWCVNTDFSQQSETLFPQVPYSREHLSEEWKRNYVKSLNGKSYQDNLLSLSQSEGLAYEMDHYGAWTIDGMRSWDYGRPNILELKFETIMSDYDESFLRIFRHLDLCDSEDEIAELLEASKKHDLKRMSDDKLKSMSHVSAKESSKWKGFFEDRHKDLFKEKFGDILISLGYEKDNNW